MVYSYTPTYYSSLHDSITSLCKTILPFPFKKRRIPAIAAAEQRLSKQQSDNLKWQQESFHQIINLMGLCKEGILAPSEVSAFRSHLLDTLIASPADHEHSSILRDKLIFLQELLYAKCISEEEYHSSKRPLLQRLALQGAEIEAKNLVVASKKEGTDEEWSVIDLKDEKKESSSLKDKTKKKSSVLGIASSNRKGETTEEMARNDLGENPFWNGCSKTKSILMVEERDTPNPKQTKSGKKHWWKRKNDSEDETAPLSLDDKSDVVNQPTGFFVDKASGDVAKNIRCYGASKEHNSKGWATFEDEGENCHPNLLPPLNKSIDKGLKYNPFFD